jgi:hypothetical protein
VPMRSGFQGKFAREMEKARWKGAMVGSAAI